MRLMIISMIALFVLTGCGDKVELEERGFVGAFSVDINDDGNIALGAELLALPEDNKEAKNGKDIKRAACESLSAAMEEINARSSKSISFALCKLCLLGGKLLEDTDRLREVVIALEQNTEISGKLIIVAVRGEAGDLLAKEISDDMSLGYYISKYYKHAKNKAESADMLELERLSEAAREGGGAIIPVLTYTEANKAVKFTGAALVLGEGLAYTRENGLNGLAWAKSLGRGRLVSVAAGDGGWTANLKVDKQTARFCFREEKDGLVCVINVKVRGALEEYEPGKMPEKPELERLFAERIIKEIRETQDILTKNGIDGYGLAERLSKWKPEIYEVFGGMPERYTIDVEAEVTIQN